MLMIKCIKIRIYVNDVFLLNGFADRRRKEIHWTKFKTKKKKLGENYKQVVREESVIIGRTHLRREKQIVLVLRRCRCLGLC